MSRRAAPAVTALLLALSGVLATAPDRQASAQNALIVDSLTALQGLVEGSNCTALNAAPGVTPAPTPSSGAEGLPYRKCDDGVPDGRTGGARGIPVPAAYHATSGDDHSGLPAPASADEVAAVDAEYDLQPDESGDR